MTTPVRHDPPTERLCLDEFDDDKAVCVCQLPDEHEDNWHACRCTATWTTARIIREDTVPHEH